MKAIFLILAALTGAPTPAPSFRAPISSETAAAIFAEIISGSEAPAHDFNGDGVLNIADFCGICHRAQINAAAPETRTTARADHSTRHAQRAPQNAPQATQPPHPYITILPSRGSPEKRPQERESDRGEGGDRKPGRRSGRTATKRTAGARETPHKARKPTRLYSYIPHHTRPAERSQRSAAGKP